MAKMKLNILKKLRNWTIGLTFIFHSKIINLRVKEEEVRIK